MTDDEKETVAARVGGQPSADHGDLPRRTTSPLKRPTRWAIRVTLANGHDAYLRHGWKIGSGSIVLFRSKRDAELSAESFVAPGLDDGSVVTVVRAPRP